MAIGLASLVLPGGPASVVGPTEVDAAGLSSTACGTSGTPAVVAVHGPHYYVDAAVSLWSRYAGYTVRAGSVGRTGLWIGLSDFTGGRVALASGQPSAQSLPNLDSGASSTRYFLTTASALTTTPQTHSITLYDASPELGGSPICTRTFTYSGVVDTIKALANKVRTITNDGPPSAVLGSTVTVSVTGDTGTLGAGPANDPGVLDLAPTALADFPAGAWQLVNASITLSPNGTLPQQTFVNRLYLSAASGPDRPYVASYTFRAVAPQASAAPVKPIQYIASGTQVKHTDLGSIPLAALPPIGSDAPLTLTKTAAVPEVAAGGGTVSYTVTATNTGSAAQTLDEIADSLPSGASYVAGSVRLAGATVAEPELVGGRLTFHGPFVVPAFASLALTYQLALDATPGPRTNSVVGYLGTVQIDSSASTTSNDPATATVVVRSAGGPQAENDTASTTANTAVTIPVLTNDGTTGTDPFEISAVGAPSSGTAVVVGDQIVYTPGATFSGTATFTYTISDGTSSDTATVTVTVAPRAVNDVYTAAKGQTKTYSTVLANDICGPTPACTVSVVTPPSAGTLAMNPDGTFTYTPANANTTGTFSFTYRATDPSTGLTTTAVATINMNDAAPDYATTPYQTAVSIDTALNDNCVQCRPSAVTSPANGSVVYPGSGATVTYTPSNGFWGLDTWIYKMPSNDQASITVLTAPPASTFTTTADTAVSGTLPAGRVCAGCTYSVASGVSSGTLSFNTTTGAFTYTPNGEFSGTDSFTYRVLDPVSGLSVTQTVTLKVGPDAVDDTGDATFGSTYSGTTATNDTCAATCTWSVVSGPAHATLSLDAATGAFTLGSIDAVGPVTFTYRIASSVTPGLTDTATVTITVAGASDDSASTTIGAPVNVAVQANDLCAACTVTAVSTPSAGSAVIEPDGTITYTPPAGFSGTATFTYTVSRNGGTDTATVTIEVLPSAVDDSTVTLVDTPVSLSLTANDLCAGCSVSATDTPPNGSVQIGTLGRITYTPADGFVGTDTFDYTATDANGNDAQASVTVTVAAPPTLAPDNAVMTADTSVLIPVLDNDACAGCGVEIATDPNNGSVSVTATGEILYVPRPGFSGTDTFTYTATDPVSGVSATETVTVTVLPTATDDVATTAIDTPVSVDVRANDSCTLCAVTIMIPPDAASGTASVVDDEILFTPAPGFSGTVTIGYMVTDTNGNTAEATLTITVNDAVRDARTTPFETAITGVDVLTNDVCAGCSVTEVGTTPGGTASIAGDGTVTFVPAAGFSGIAEFSYTASDGARTVTSTVRILVGPPVVTIVTDPGTPVSRNALTGSSCSGCRVGQATAPDNGEVEVSLNGDYTYVPAALFTGTDTFDYTVTDPETGLSVPGTINVVVDEQPGIGIVVTANGFTNTVVDPGGRTDAGDTGNFLIDVTNTGQKTLGTVTVAVPAGATIDCGDGSGDDTIADLAVGATITCVASVTLSQADMDAATISLEATATGDASGFPLVTATDTDDQSIIASSSIQLDKGLGSLDTDDVGPADRLDAGDAVVFSFVVTNTSNVTLSSITVSDPLAGLSALDCGADVNGSIDLAPGEQGTCTARYVLDQTTLDAGSVSNAATVDATTPTGGLISGEDDTVVSLTADASIDVTTTPDVTIVSTVGTVVTYTIVATNDGNVTLSAVAVADGLPGLSGLDCGPFLNGVDALAPGESVTCTGTYTVTQADLDAGSIVDAAAAGGTPPTGTDVEDTAQSLVDVEQTPEVTLTVVADTDLATALGQTITLTYRATNTGNVTLTAVTIAEDLAGASPVDCTPFVNGTDGLAPGEDVTCTATFTVTQAHIDGGSVDADATVTATPPSGSDVTDTATDTVAVTQTPNLTLAKTSDVSSVTTAGDVITFTLVATNTGNVTLTAVALADTLPGLSALDCGTDVNGAITLAPGATATCTATYTATQADIDGGSITNGASVSAESPDGTTPDAADSETVAVDGGASVTIAKTADVATVTAAGDVITYTIEITNSGDLSLTGVTVSDPLPGLSALDCGGFADGTDGLVPGASATCTATYTVTQADVDAGGVTNTASVSADAGRLGEVTDEATTTVAAPAAPALDVFKSADVTTVDGAGDVITYTIDVENVGNVTVSGISVSDPLPGLSALDCGADTNGAISLAPGDTATCTATYTVTQADIDAGSVDNRVSVDGSTPDGDPVTNDDALRVPATELPALTVTKTSDTETIATVGQTITYTFTATNTGNVTLTQVVLADALVGLSPLTCGDDSLPATLAPTDQVVCTATYSVTQDDLDSGALVNVVDVSATSPGGDTPTATGGTTIPLEELPALTVEKIADVASVDAVGDTIAYMVTLSNTGNVDVSSVDIDDPLPGLSALDCGGFPTDGSGVLAAGASVVCSATYSVTQADLDAGSIANEVTVSGDSPGGVPVTRSDSATVDVARSAALGLSKTADPMTVAAAGETVAFSFLATNIGNVTLTDVTVTDAMVGLSAVDCGTDTNGEITLAPGESATCSATYAATQADLDAGSLRNAASADAVGPEGPVPTAGDEVVVAVDGAPALALTKTADTSAVLVAGEVITFTLTVENVGNVSIDDVVVTDTKPGLSPLDCGDFAGRLAPEDSVTCTASYSVTQDDVDSGVVANSASVSGDVPGIGPVSDETDMSVDATQQPELTVTKAADVASVTVAGDVVTYTITVVNSGNVTATNVVVTDAMPDLSALDCGDQPNDGTLALAPGETMECTASYEADQTDVDAGSILNTAEVTAETLLGAPITGSAEESVTVDRGPGITLHKTAEPAVVSAVGDVVTFTLSAANTGNVTLTDVTLADSMIGLSDLDCGGFTNGGSLPPGVSATCAATYTVTQADLDAGVIANAATVSADAPGGATVDHEATVDVDVDQAPAFSIVKDSDVSTADALGDVVTYTITVANTGNVTLSDVAVTDPLDGLSPLDCPDLSGVLTPGTSVTCTATYELTVDDLVAGSLVNTATVAGVGPDGTPVDRNDSVTIEVTATPAITLDKTASTTQFSAVGDVVEYSLLVANSGNVPLSDVVVSDPLPGLGAIDCGTGTPGAVGTLDPGQSVECVTVLTIDQSHLDGGALVNTATASGVGPLAARGARPGEVSATDSAEVEPAQVPAIALTRTADVEVLTEAGQEVVFTYRITNTGNVTLDGIAVVDPLPGLSDIDCGGFDGTLSPGSTVTCTATYVVTPADIEAGEIASRVSVEGLPPSGTAVVDADEGALPVATAPAVRLAKTASPRSVGAAGERITYTFAVRNVGNTPLTSVRVVDEMPGLSAITCDTSGPLDPNEARTCTAIYTVTQADVDAGTVTNQASVRAEADGTVVRHTDSVDVATDGTPSVTLTKTASPSIVSEAGDLVVFTFEVHNTGTVVLDDVEITDPMPGLSAVECPDRFDGSLAPDETVRCRARYRVTDADIAAGTVVNTATVRSRATGVAVPATSESTASVQTSRAARIAIDKTASATQAAAGQVITYSLRVTNTGEIPLTDIVVTDPLPGLSAIDCGDFDGSLDPDQSATCEATYEVGADDGDILNTATVQSVGGGVPIADTGSVTVAVPAGGLPDTGADVGRILLVAAIAVFAGLVLVREARRRREPVV